MYWIVVDCYRWLYDLTDLDKFGSILEYIHTEENCPLDCLSLLPTLEEWHLHRHLVTLTCCLATTLYPDPRFFECKKNTRKHVLKLLHRYHTVGTRHDYLHSDYWTFRPDPA